MILFCENLVLFEVRFFKESKFEADNIFATCCKCSSNAFSHARKHAKTFYPGAPVLFSGEPPSISENLKFEISFCQTLTFLLLKQSKSE
jgi:isocitrate dehydrogenase kinase/phosphatase